MAGLGQSRGKKFAQSLVVFRKKDMRHRTAPARTCNKTYKPQSVNSG
jgi:hypothetical protein